MNKQLIYITEDTEDYTKSFAFSKKISSLWSMKRLRNFSFHPWQIFLSPPYISDAIQN